MEMSAVVATMTSVLAIGLTIVLLRLVRQERQRSDARVVALVSMAGHAPAAPEPIEPPPVRLEPRRAATVAPAPARLSAADVEIFRDATIPLIAAPSTHELFEPAVPRGRSPLLYVGVGAIVVASVIAMGFRWALSGSAQPTTETSASISAPAAPAAQPLSLLALRHEQGADGTLVISGVVMNPAGSIARERVFAAASLVDQNGALVASARAPLDFTALSPGEESPFVVRITGATNVARYRVGFRDAEGAAIPHVDRR